MEEQGNNTRNSIYGIIVDFIVTNGYSLSLREIVDGTGMKSISSVKDQLFMLECLGKIHTQEFKARTISIVGYEFRKVD